MSADRERLFFALWPPETLRVQIAASTRELVRAAGGRTVPPANYHVTLAFLGTVPATERPAAIAAAQAVQFAAFELTLDRSGYWPRSRIGWLGPPECPPGLAALEQMLWQELAGAGFARESRPYRPHLSLVRQARTMPAVRLPEPLGWEVDEFVLVRSDTRPGGAHYTPLEQFHAGG